MTCPTFPSNPSIGQEFTFGDITYKWTGTTWDLVDSVQGPLQHNDLEGLNLVGAHDASAISNANGGSVQDFIDGLAAPDSTVLVGGVEAGVIAEKSMGSVQNKDLPASAFSNPALNNVNIANTPGMAWGGKGVCILGDSITHGAFSIDIAKNNWHSILRRMIMIDVGKSNYGFVTAVPSIGSGATESKDVHEVLSTNGFSSRSLGDASNSMSGWWYQTFTAGATITVKVPVFQKQVAVIYEADAGNGAFSVSINGVVAVPSVDCSVGSGGFFKGGLTNLVDDGTGYCTVTVTSLNTFRVRIAGFMYENETNGYQFNAFAQSGRRLRWTDNAVIDAAITGATTFILALGLNDSFSESDPSYMSEFTARIDRIISTATAQGVKVIIADFCWSKTLENSIVRRELKRCADNIPGATYIPFPDYLRLNGAVTTGSYLINTLKLFTDESHPNIEGHRWIAETIAKVLNISVKSKAQSLKQSPFWNVINLSGTGLKNILTDWRGVAAWRLSGNDLQIRGSLQAAAGGIPAAGTYPFIPANFASNTEVYAYTSYPVKFVQANDGAEKAILRMKQGVAGVDVITDGTVFPGGCVTIPNVI